MAVWGASSSPFCSVQQAADRGLAAIAARLDERKDNLPFFRLKLRPKPQLLHDVWDRGDMCGRYVDAFILGRSMTGLTDYVAQEKSLRRLLDKCDPYENPFMATRMLIARVDLFLADRTPQNKKAVEDLAERLDAPFTGIWLETPRDARLARVADRAASPHRDPSDADASVAARQDAAAPAEAAWIRLDASGQSKRTAALALRALNASSRPLAALPPKKET